MAKKKDKREKRRMGNVRKRAEQVDSGFQTAYKVPEGLQRWKPKKGINRFDIIPYILTEANAYGEEGDMWYEKTFEVHRNVGIDESPRTCPRLVGKKCPIHEHAAHLRQDPDTDKDDLKPFKTSKRQLFLIVDHDDREAGIQLFEISCYAFGDLLQDVINDCEEEDKEAYENFASPTEGLSIRANFKEEDSGQGNKYLKAKTIEFRGRKKQYDDDIIDHGFNLDDLPIVLDYKDLKNEFLQVDSDSDDEEDDDDDDTDKKSKSKKSSPKKKSRDDDDDDEEDDDDEPPKKKSKSKKDDEEDEDEDEEDDDDDDDDDEPTAKDLGIKVGTLVKHKKHGECKVVHVSGDGTSLRIEDEDDEVHKAIAPSEVKVLKSKSKKDEDDDEDEDEPKSKKKDKKSKSKDEDDEDDDIPFEEDDEDDDEPPKKDKKSSKKKSKDDDEDDDD